jgi:hypothetical protein
MFEEWIHELMSVTVPEFGQKGRQDGRESGPIGIPAATNPRAQSSAILGTRLGAFSGIRSGSRVCFMINIHQTLLRDVGVNLSCGQIAMSK